MTRHLRVIVGDISERWRLYPDDHAAYIRDGGSLTVEDRDGVTVTLYSPTGWLEVDYYEIPEAAS